MESIIPLVVFVAGGALGFALARLTGRRDAGVPREQLEAALREQAVLKAKAEAAEEARAEARGARDAATRELAEARETIASITAQKKAQDDRMAEHQAAVKAMQEQNRQEFANLANKILEQSSVKFSENSQKSIGDLLNPLRERLNDFQKKVDESFGAQGKEQFALKEEIKRIVEVNEKMRLQADSLTKALKGDSKAQGNWGEVVLERILEDAGLQKGREYTLQGAELGLKHIEHGGQLRPDVIVNLPDGKHIIVDSKVTLTSYERYCAEGDEAARALHLKAYLQSIRGHVNDLAGKRYQDMAGLGTPDFVFLFMPIEGAYSLAMQQDTELHAYAWNKRVVVVCPSTLFATLRTVASLWKIELQNRNTLKIAEAGGKLYDKLVGFVDDMQKIGKSIDALHSLHEGALNKLSTGKGNALRQAEQMKVLGAKAGKSLPAELLDAAEVEPEDRLIEAAM